MNERIKELSGKALDIAIPETYTQISLSQFQKFRDVFAELIIKECVRVGREEFLNDNSRCPVFPSDAIKSHFGVE